ncbi:hypothetical protein BDZ97DRAFT_1762377 [Flammula alnicola]|nr:hypothetical protein BDZ97DRAFT_1762377 [Flammula alnicola]
MFSRRSLLVIMALCLSVAVLSAPISESGEIEVRGFPAGKKATPPASVASQPAKNARNSVANAKKTAAKTCVLPALPKHQKRSFTDDLVNLFDRNDAAEFIGWHGTNHVTSHLWTSKGEIIKPVTVNHDGSAAGRSGLDAELGPGLYITDTLSTAEVAAVINYKFQEHHKNEVNPSPSVCAIFARSSNYWRKHVNKQQIPDNLRGNGERAELLRQAYIGARHGNINTVRFGTLRQVRGQENQLLIPESLNPKLYAQCFDDVNALTGVSPRAHAFQQQMGTAAVSKYNSPDKLHNWIIVPEDQVVVDAAKAAIEHGGHPKKMTSQCSIM